MAGAIKGITIEFRGDTSSLDKALNNVKKEAKGTANELKYIDKAIKFNPTSVDAWKQKQVVLNKAIKETKEKLSLMKQGLKEMEAQGLNEENSEEFRRMQREIDQTERYLKSLENELKSVGNVKLKAASEQFKKWGSALDSAGQKMKGLSTAAAIVTGAIGGMAVKSGKWADDINTMSKQYGISTDNLQKYSIAADLVDVSTEAIAKTQTKMKKSMLSAQDGTGATAEAFEKLGVSVTDSDGNLRDGEQVWEDTIAALGEMSNETERDALAMQLMGKSANELNPLIADGGETYKNMSETLSKYGLDFVDEDTLKRANEFNDELDTIKAVGLVAFQSVGTELAAHLAPAFQKVVDWAGKLASWISKMDPQIMTVVATIGAVVAGMAPLLIGLGKMAFAISSIINVVNTIGPAVGKALTAFGPWGLVIAGVIAAGILLYKNWDKIKIVALKLVKDLKIRWNKIKQTIVTAVSSIADKIREHVDKWKNIFINAWEAIKKAVSTAITAVRNVITTGFNLIKAVFTMYIKIWRTIFTVGFNAIKRVVSVVITGIKTIITVGFTVIKTIFTTYVNIWKKIITTIFTGIKIFIQREINGWKKIITVVWNAIKAVTSRVWSGIKTAITTPINAAKSVITSVISKIKSLFNFSGIASKVKSAFNKVKSAISSPIEKAKNLVKAAVDKIRKIFPIKLGKIFKGVKLPHFKISGGKIPWGIGGEGKKPSVSIDWYKKGGIFKQPTLLTSANGLKGVGEAGAEAVLPLDTFWKHMADMGNDIIKSVQGQNDDITINVYASEGMDIKQLTDEIERRLVEIQKRRRVAWQ